MEGFNTATSIGRWGIITTALFVVPFVVMGAEPKLGSYGKAFIDQLADIVAYLIPVVFALILLAFFWGLAKFIFGGAEDAKTKGKNIMLWSVIALFLAASVWGIVNILQTLFGTTDDTVTVPTVKVKP